MILPIPSHLGGGVDNLLPFLGQLANLKSKQYNDELQARELQLRQQQMAQQAAQQAAALQAQQAEALNTNALNFMKLNAATGLQQQDVALEREKLAEQARQDAIRYQGARDYERDVASGMAPEVAIQKNLGKLTYNQPSAFASIASTTQRGADQFQIQSQKQAMAEALEALKAGNKTELEKVKGETAKQISDAKNETRLEAERIRALNRPGLKGTDRVLLESTLKAIEKDPVMSFEEKQAKMKEVADEFGKVTPQTSGIIRISTKAERDALPSGTKYIGPDGIEYTKK